MSRGGSTTAWRKLRRLVGVRDGMRCRRPLCPCGGVELTWERNRPNTLTAGHIVAVVDGGTDSPDNLRAECARENYAEGARITNTRRRRSRLNTSREW